MFGNVFTFFRVNTKLKEGVDWVDAELRASGPARLQLPGDDVQLENIQLLS